MDGSIIEAIRIGSNLFTPFSILSVSSTISGNINIKEIDRCIAMPHLMPRIGKQDGSVTTDISRAVKEAKKSITFKKDKSAVVHVGLGRIQGC
ncbi:hypothetical protein L1987_54914 [Smallanthus sonchifolius]|uniref:Uncharacterized protein n=1 Tax=Smallanthus sonchifolius TaxID=185202 RepID=A0ACB9E8X3_9ASTR|nr:hypothetical protein L1987_54914 [Smallanthus sonchifolius]